MELVDSHAHLDGPEFSQDRAEVLTRAKENSVRWILCPLDIGNENSLRVGLNLSRNHPEIFLAAGIHPHQAKELQEKHLDKIKKLAEEKKILAVGEIGLDFHYNFSPPEKQLEAFRLQLKIASELGLPVIIHSRQAAEKIIDSIKTTGFKEGGILHCFTESWSLAKAMLDKGFMVSFSGILTYKNAENLREIARKLPLECLLVETDSPYLTPFPEKKTWKRNEPAFVVSTVRDLARQKNISVEKMAEITTENFFRFFKLKK
ncbi:MAG: TatD family hydrolase [Candidatus Saccharicenans sp.]